MSVRAYIVFSFAVSALGAACGRIGFEALEQRSEAADAFDAGPIGVRPGDGGAAPVADGASGSMTPDSGAAPLQSSEDGGTGPSRGPNTSSDGGGSAGVSGGETGGSAGSPGFGGTSESTATSGSSGSGTAGSVSGAGGAAGSGVAGAPSGGSSNGGSGGSSNGGSGGSSNGGSGGSSNGGSAGAVPAETCADGQLNPDESDTDCGGECGPCDVGQSCNTDTDCSDDVCLTGLCRTAGTCSDATQNQDESDTDCGGVVCPTCADGLACARDLDCTSNSCISGTCQGAGTCNDVAQNQDETGVDCGGLTCPACADGMGCEVGNDCQSGLCAGQVCTSATSTCMDTADCTCDTHGGHEYWFCRVSTLADAAPAVCSTVGMTLVRIDDADENDWLLQQATAHGLHGVSDIFLIGANKVNTDPDWVWPDGEAFWTGTSSGGPLNGLYSNWNSRAPRSQFDCVCMLDIGEWLDLGCGAAEPFVCESP